MADKPPAELAMQIAKRLTAMRLQKEWTREKLASLSGVNVHTLKHFERSGQISFERLIAICQSLNISHEIERVFKPRHRVDVENWEVKMRPARQRGRRQIDHEPMHSTHDDQLVESCIDN